MADKYKVDEERYFFRQYGHGHLTEQMKEMPHSELLEYAGQMWRRLDRIIAIMDRQKSDPEVNHSVKSLMKALERQADTEFDERCLGYDQNAGEDNDSQN